MYGVLVDVSGSMREAYALERSSSTQNVTVERTHAILTTTLNIVKQKVSEHGYEQDNIFVCAFGTQEERLNDVTCDLLSLLDLNSECVDVDGHKELIRLAWQHGASHAEPWIPKHLTRFEASVLYTVLRSDTKLQEKLINLIPGEVTMMAANGTSFVTSPLRKYLGIGKSCSEESLAQNSSAYKFAHDLIIKKLSESGSQPLSPRPVRQVSNSLDKLLSSHKSDSTSVLHNQIQEVIDAIKPFIYGNTPMCKALTDAHKLFSCATSSKGKVLFILSDGRATDGNPLENAQALRDSGVKIATCFLTSDYIDTSKRLYNPEHQFGEKGRQALFEMSSSMKNSEKPLSYLSDTDWELPYSGTSRLFIQANTLDVVNEFCKIVVAHMN